MPRNLIFYVHVGEMEERERREDVCRLTNITVLRLFFLFLFLCTTLLRRLCVWFGGTLLMQPEGLREEGSEVGEGRARPVLSSGSDSLGGGRAAVEEPPRLIVIMDDPWWQRQSSHHM